MYDEAFVLMSQVCIYDAHRLNLILPHIHTETRRHDYTPFTELQAPYITVASAAPPPPPPGHHFIHIILFPPHVPYFTKHSHTYIVENPFFMNFQFPTYNQVKKKTKNECETNEQRRCADIIIAPLRC